MTLEIRKNKRIGQVIIMFEGEEMESKLLNHFFTDVLDYNCVSYDRQSSKIFCYKSKTDNLSRVYLIPANKTQIKNISFDNEYYDKLYRVLSTDYGLSVENSAVYYLFDRDRISNKKKDVLNAIRQFSNSRDNNDYEMNGLLLLSYPCFESYLLSSIGKDLCVDSSQMTKLLWLSESIPIDKINENEMKTACVLMLEGIKESINTELCLEDIDNFSPVNEEMLNYEENLFANKNVYKCLSLLSVVFIDLGIIEIK